MDTSTIIKKSVTFPFRAYKGFILTIFLFFISEMISEILASISISNVTPLLRIVTIISQILLLGTCISVVYHYIDESFDIKEMSLTYTAKIGFKDMLVESYYYSLVVICTSGLTFVLGIYRNIHSIIDQVLYLNNKLSHLTFPKLLKYLSPESYAQLSFSITIALLIFMIFFAVFLSYCSIAKIRLRETGDLKESMNFIKLSKIIKSKGIRRYLNFVILAMLMLAATFIIMRTLQPYIFIDGLLSSFTEAFSLFFILDSFTLFYKS